MDVLLITLGVLGFGAILVSAYVFTVAARNYVSDDHKKDGSEGVPSAPYSLVPRSREDRRSGQSVSFPLTVNGILITHDRRNLPDRRRAA